MKLFGRTWRARSALLAMVAVGLGTTSLVAVVPSGAADSPSATSSSGRAIAPSDTTGSSSLGEPRFVESAPDEPQAAAAVGSPAADAPFRPTMDAEDYKNAKAAAATQAKAGRPGAPEATDAADASQAAEASAAAAPSAPTLVRSFEGLNSSEAGGWRPPDTHGAQGAGRYVEIVNSAVRMWNTTTSPPSVVKTTSLATFFSHTATGVFDPRVVFDTHWNRWILLAEAFPESSTVQRLMIAVTTTSDPAGSYWLYHYDVGGSASNEVFFDYPQLGYDQDAIYITANIFPNSGGFAGAQFRCLSKAALYNGRFGTSPIWNGLDSTLAPPIVLDNLNRGYLVAAANGTHLSMYRATSCGRSGTSLLKTSVDVPDYSVPPNAPQPGTNNLLDTLDRRFVNASTQYGTSLWNVHTINVGGFATPRFYELNINTNTVKQSGLFFEQGSSHDFNASIMARPTGTAFVTWTSTAVSGSAHQARIRASSRKAADPAGSISAGVSVWTSPTFYNPSSDTVERWGDYSAVWIDQATGPERAYIVNEKINSNAVWGSRIAQIGA